MPHATLLGYRLDQPSFRYRMMSLVGALEEAGWTVQLERFPSGRYGVRTWEGREPLRRSDIVGLQKMKPPGAEARLFAAYAPRRIFDFADGIYVPKPRHLGESPDDSWW